MVLHVRQYDDTHIKKEHMAHVLELVNLIHQFPLSWAELHDGQIRVMVHDDDKEVSNVDVFLLETESDVLLV